MEGEMRGGVIAWGRKKKNAERRAQMGVWLAGVF